MASRNSGLIYVNTISKKGLTIYDEIPTGDKNYWIPTETLESLLNEGLRGISLKGLPLRTRSKFVKKKIAQLMGYPTPKTFKKTQPRFPGQNLDIYIQKSNNLQIWNEEIEPSRRYAVVKVDPNNIIVKVKVVTGDVIADLDTTGTLTQKYQARLNIRDAKIELISREDTENLKPIVKSNEVNFNVSPLDNPTSQHLLPIKIIFSRLKKLVDIDFPEVGYDQERNRGAKLHQLVCMALGYKTYEDDGKFPDVRNQLLEVKLQTSPTIDLGLILPSSAEPLDIPMIEKRQIKHQDVRYAIYNASTDGNRVRLKNFYLTTGLDFFTRFPQFQGRVVNKKLQIPLPSSFFKS